jgi:hypothetical protein
VGGRWGVMPWFNRYTRGADSRIVSIRDAAAGENPHRCCGISRHRRAGITGGQEGLRYRENGPATVLAVEFPTPDLPTGRRGRVHMSVAICQRVQRIVLAFRQIGPEGCTHRQPTPSEGMITSCRCCPRPSMVKRITSPDRRNLCGFKPNPTPLGVPVAMISPG